jgi:hypothetical protein
MDVSRSFNNLSRFSGGKDGSNMAVWIVLGLIGLVAIFVVMWQYEFFGCTNGRMVLNGKCANMCPEGLTFGSVGTENNVKKVSCSKDNIFYSFYPIPTEAPVPTPAAAAKK